jgi:lysophospholipase L1-like esterase
MTAPGERPRRSVRLAAIALAAVALLAAAELGARALMAARESLREVALLRAVYNRFLVLDPYEAPHPEIAGHWTLRPGFASPDGKLTVNAAGFKGKEIAREAGRPRIVAIGDSCTFGQRSNGADYPSYAAERLAASGGPVDMVNAGVEGYSTGNVLREIDRYLALRADLALLYIGWNDIFAEEELVHQGVARYLYAARLLKRVGHIYRWFVDGPEAAALALMRKPKRPLPDAAEVRALDRWEPPFVAGVERIADRLAAAGTRPVILTLPGLFASGETPSATALERGHLPQFTDNPFVLARVAERTNDALRALARRRGFALIDLARFADGSLAPRDAYFNDSVHLNERGLAEIAAFVAKEVRPLVDTSARAGRGGG